MNKTVHINESPNADGSHNVSFYIQPEYDVAVSPEGELVSTEIRPGEWVPMGTLMPSVEKKHWRDYGVSRTLTQRRIDSMRT